MANTPVLTPREVDEALELLPAWTRDADRITAAFAMESFPVAIELVDRVAVAAEDAGHHPDIDIRWRTVTFTLTTHDAGGVTHRDLALAGRIQGSAQALGWRRP